MQRGKLFSFDSRRGITGGVFNKSRAFSDHYVKLRGKKKGVLTVRRVPAKTLSSAQKLPCPPAAELFARQYLLAFSYLHSASHEDPLYMPVVYVQMFTGLVKEAAAALKVTVMQNRMRQPSATASGSTLKLTRIRGVSSSSLIYKSIIYLRAHLNDKKERTYVTKSSAIKLI